MIFLNISATKDYPYLHSAVQLSIQIQLGGINDSSNVKKYKIATYPTIMFKGLTWTGS